MNSTKSKLFRHCRENEAPSQHLRETARGARSVGQVVNRLLALAESYHGYSDRAHLIDINARYSGIVLRTTLGGDLLTEPGAAPLQPSWACAFWFLLVPLPN